MTEVLSQSEIEALLSEIATPQVDTEQVDSDKSIGFGPPSSGSIIRQTSARVFVPVKHRKNPKYASRKGSIAYEPYDFRRPDKLSKEHLRSLQVLNENFARLFASSISGFFRAQVEMELVSLEQVPYEEYARSISGSLIYVLSVSPLSGQVAFEIDLRIMFVMLDRLLGGTGSGGQKGTKDLTEIENALAGSIVRRALTDFSTAWENIAPLEFEIVSVETTAQFLQIVPNNDTVMLLLFEVKIGEHQGSMSLCIPYLLLKPILGRLSTQQWVAHGARKPSVNLATQIASRLRPSTKITCQARVGTVRLTVAELSDLEPGQVLPLTTSAGTPNVRRGNGIDEAEAAIGHADILVGTRPKFRGRVGLRGKTRLAVKIEEILPPTPTLVFHKEVN